MDRAGLSLNLALRTGVLVLSLAGSAAFAQTAGGPATGPAPQTSVPAVVPPGTTPADVAPAPGLPGPQSVDPAPGASGPYAGHSEQTFYDVNGRIASVEQKIQTTLTGAQQKKAMGELNAIKAEEKNQVARHGSLLDWARENLNHRLDQLVQSYPSLKG